MNFPPPENLRNLIRRLALQCGISDVGFSSGNTQLAEPQLRAWLAAGCHGEMEFMDHHADFRCQPETLVPGTVSVISATFDYWPDAEPAVTVLNQPDKAYISRYALGRDYHKLIRQRLQKLATLLSEQIGSFGYRVFSDSAPVFEVEFATQAHLGWRGKHSLLLNRTGSWHFLGEIYTDLPLLSDLPETEIPNYPETHCGSCTRCLQTCPTQAIIAPYQVDARRCISYLTIEHAGPIPTELRPLLGNRIYGCDDCQLVCPWNRFATQGDPNFSPRHQLDNSSLIALFAWTEPEFNDRLAGNPIRRIGYEQWLRNIAVALGNALRTAQRDEQGHLLAALVSRQVSASLLVQEHISWAISQQPR